MRKLVVGFCFALAACGNADQPILNAGKSLVSGLGKQAEPEKSITAEQFRAAATPEAVAKLKNDLLLVEVFDRNAAVTMVPSYEYGPYVTWIGTDGISITTKHGVIIETRGLGFDLMSSDVEEPIDRITNRNVSITATRVQSYLDGEDQEYSRSFKCEYESKDDSILETCFSTNLQIENQYWVSNSGQVWRAKQWIGDENGTIQVELLTR